MKCGHFEFRNSNLDLFLRALFRGEVVFFTEQVTPVTAILKVFDWRRFGVCRRAATGQRRKALDRP